MLFDCGTCDAWFWSPLKNPGAEWYEKDTRYAGRNRDPLMKPNWNHLKVISKLAPMYGRVLDVGCGTGNFLYYARSQKWDPYGLDFDRDAVRVANTLFQLPNVELGDIIEYARKHPERKFDLVTFFDVFEHIDNHADFIEAVKQSLRDGGYVAMSMPYRHHADWLMRGDLPPRHLTCWDRHSLQMYLERHGFEIVYMTRYFGGLRYLIVKLRFLYGTAFSFGLVDKTKRALRNDGHIHIGSPKERVISVTATLASMKDAVLFGIPAIIIYLVMLPTRKRYISLYCIARKRQESCVARATVR